MKNLILPFLLSLATYTYGQSAISSLNTGAVSNNNLVYSVGEIFVIPTTHPNDANSGLIGAVSRINFFVTGINENISSADWRVFPNPTTNYIYFESTENNLFQQVYIYDNTGRLVLQQNTKSASIDLTHFSNGIYTILTDNPKIKSFKIIKQ